MGGEGGGGGGEAGEGGPAGGGEAGAQPQPPQLHPPEEQQQAAAVAESVYRLKRVDFLGQPVRIVLQNDNGPCPLIAISNVLLLRGQISVPLDRTEIYESSLLSLVVERVFDANTSQKDDVLEANQRQNIADAISLLPKLTTGVDVNVRFQRINDFEFTPEVAIFDLLNISLVHGWLVDPQDQETASIIGNSSYNNLVEKLVAAAAAVEAQPSAGHTTARAGVEPIKHIPAQFADTTTAGEQVLTAAAEPIVAEADAFSDVSAQLTKLQASTAAKLPAPSIVDASPATTATDDEATQPATQQTTQPEATPAALESPSGDNATQAPEETKQPESGAHAGEESAHVDADATPAAPQLQEEKRVELTSSEHTQSSGVDVAEPEFGTDLAPTEMLEPTPVTSSSTRRLSGMQLQEMTDLLRSASLRSEGSSMVTELHEALVVENFLSLTASQLTYHGLVSLYEGLKERELCVFFRNNHFNTIFKNADNLYLLVTDQGYLNEQELVWERLSEVDNDTQFCTSAFGPYRPDVELDAATTASVSIPAA
eukprot:jgi/Chlat1/4559/Chrsp29S00340